MARFTVTPPPRKAPRGEPFAAQLALARVHPCLVALERTVGGYTAPHEVTRDWFELHPKRGFAGYGLTRALRMLLDLLAGLSALEDTRTEAGEPFVHGELVPAMVRVDRSGTARLIPLAPWHWAEPGRLPASERCGHLAPERLLGDAIDARADVFSAGILLWEALAGRRLFETDSVDSIVMRLMGGKVTLPELPPELSWAAPLKAVAMCALSVDPEQRFGNCAELADAIEAVAADQLASHADVANYFVAPHLTARPSVIARPPSLPAHHSSLSALVAPVRPSALPETNPYERVSRNSESGHRAGRPLWVLAAISCVLSAFGVSAVARYHAGHEQKHAAEAPALGQPLAVSPTPLTSAPQASAMAAATDAATPPAALPAQSSTPLSDTPVAPSKPQKFPNVSKGIVPKLRPLPKVVHSPDRAAVKYGI